MVDNYRNMFESKISAGALEKYQFPRNRMRIFPHGPVTWKVMQRSEWKDIANWRTKQLNSYTKSQHHVMTTTNSKKKKWESVGELSKFCSQIVLKGLYLARIGRPDILWSVNKLARAVTKCRQIHLLHATFSQIMVKHRRPIGPS